MSKICSQCPRTIGVNYSLHRTYEGNHINLCVCSHTKKYIYMKYIEKN